MRRVVLAALLGFCALVAGNGRALADEDLSDDPAADLVGRYQLPGKPVDSIAVDVKLTGPSKLSFAGLHDDWQGTFTPGDDENPPRVTFTRKPSAAEMDESIPEWARRQVEGTLTWRMELEFRDCGPITLQGKWYPGEIKWREERDPSTGAIRSRTATVIGDGEPRDVSWEKEVKEPEFDVPELDTAVLTVAPVDNPLARLGLNAVTLGQPFFLVVRMGSEQAKQVGNSLQVTLTAEKSGRTSTVELTRFGGANANPVVFTTGEPIMLGEPFMNLDSYINLKLSSGEVVTASYGAQKRSFAVYPSWVQAGIASFKARFDALAQLYQAVMLDPRTPPDQKEEMHQKVQLIANARLFMSYEPAPDENFTDYSRYELGAAYLSLVESSTKGLRRLGGAPANRYGVSYLFQEESERAAEAIRRGVERYRQAFLSMSKELAFGTYEFIAQQTGAGQFVTLVWGIDIYGNPVDMTDRVMAGIGLGSQLLLVGASTASNIAKLQQTHLEGAYEDAIRSWHANRAQSEAPIAERAGGSAAATGGTRPNFIRYIGEKQGPNIEPVPTQEHLVFNRLDSSDTGFSPAVRQQPMNSGGTPPQLGNHTCGINVAEGMLRDAGFPPLTEPEAVGIAKIHGFYNAESIQQLDQFNARLQGGGMTYPQMQAYLEYHGASVRSTARPTLPSLANELGKGRKIAVIINAGTDANPAYHWIRIEGFSCGKNGRLMVNIGDPWTGGSWAVRSDVLTRRMKAAVSADFSGVTRFVR
ncbi:MAG: hypothetical protein ACOY3L_14880 [Pseudomonadota bacterium]